MTSASDDDVVDGRLTLRAAIVLANARPGADRITFAIPGPGPYTIALSSPLPPLRDTTILDALTAEGASIGPVVEIDGRDVRDRTVAGLRLLGCCSVVRGLALVRFGADAIEIAGSGGHVVETCSIGVGLTRSAEHGNGGCGIVVRSSGNRIGGAGDLAPTPGNTIELNGGPGISIAGGSQTVVQGNTIAHNGGSGVIVAAGVAHSIGGTQYGDGNLITGNDGAGVRVAASARAMVLLNQIDANAWLGIDVGAFGVGRCDPRVTDVLCHDLPEAPRVESVAATCCSTRVRGTLVGTPGDRVRLEFYEVAVPDRSGCGEGTGLLGIAFVEVDPGGLAIFDVVFAATPSGDYVTATMTSAKATSEYSYAVGVER